MRPLLRIRNARIYLAGDVISTLGDSALWLALSVWVKEMTGSSSLAGLVMFCYAAGSLLGPLTGVLVDRFRRRPLLIWCHLIAAAFVLLLLFVHDRSMIWLVYLVMVGYGIIGSAIDAGETALVPALVPDDLLGAANGVQQTLRQGLRLLAPLIGAGLFTLVGASVVVEIDAATFVLGALALAALRVTEQRPEPADDGTGRQTVAGFRYLAGEPVLRSITLALALSMLVMGFTESAGFSVVTVGLHRSASFVGVLMSVQGVGSILGGLIAAPALRRTSERVMVGLGLGLVAAAVLLLALPWLPVVVAGMALAGFAIPGVIVAATTALQRRTPSALLGRVSGAFGLGLTLPQVVSVGLGAALLAIVGYRVLLVVIAIVVAVAVAILTTGRDRGTPPAGEVDVPPQAVPIAGTEALPAPVPDPTVPAPEAT